MSTYTLLLFIIVSATFIYFPEKQKQQVTEALEVKAQSIVQMLALGISHALDEGNYDLILNVFNLTQADTNIVYIALLDEIGDEIISFNPREIQTPNIIQDSPKKVHEELGMLYMTQRLQIEDEIQGNLVIGYSLKGREATLARIRWTAFWFSIVIFLIAIIVSDFIGRQITKPIKKVVENLQEIGSKETYGKKIEKDSTDEIGSLIDGFNDMSAKIHTRTQELKEHQKNLIQAEQQRVMLESIGATLHHFSQPLTSMVISIESLIKNEHVSEEEKTKLYAIYKKSTVDLNEIIRKFQKMREYRTKPYAAGVKILDIDSEDK